MCFKAYFFICTFKSKAIPLWCYPEYNLFTLEKRLIPIDKNAGRCEATGI